MKDPLWRRKVVQPLLALTIALGITLGVTPVLGSTALLCTLAAVAFRLNLAAIQLVNWLVYPLQIALLVPFLRIGAWMFRNQPSELSVARILAFIRTNVFQAITTLWTVTIHAVAAWLLLGSIATWLLYVLLVPVFCRMQTQLHQATGEQSC